MNLAAAFLLWLSMLALVLANNALGDVQIALASGVGAAEIYKAVVPVPYIGLCAWVVARRRPAGAGIADAMVVGMIWALSTIIGLALAARYLQGLNWRQALASYQFWEGYWFALVPGAQLVFPALAYRLIPRANRTA